MDPNDAYYIPHDSNPPSIIASFFPQSAHQHLAEYPGMSAIYVEFNGQWGPEQANTVVFIENQMTGGESAASNHTATTGGDFQCRWPKGDSGILCSQGFTEFDELIVHLRLHGVRGPAEEKLVCQWLTERGFCGKELRRDGFKRHIGKHIGRSVACPECDQSFSREDTLRDHKKKHDKK